jgi:hypothetical protein
MIGAEVFVPWLTSWRVAPAGLERFGIAWNRVF